MEKMIQLGNGEMLKVTFAKIPNKKMSAIYRNCFAFIGSAMKTLSSEGMSELAVFGAIAENLVDPKVEWMRDLFFEYIIVEGIGELGKNYDRLCDTYGVTVETPIFIEACKFYLGELLPQLEINIPAFKPLRSVFQGANIQEKVKAMMTPKDSSGTPSFEKQ